MATCKCATPHRRQGSIVAPTVAINYVTLCMGRGSFRSSVLPMNRPPAKSQARFAGNNVAMCMGGCTCVDVFSGACGLLQTQLHVAVTPHHKCLKLNMIHCYTTSIGIFPRSIEEFWGSRILTRGVHMFYITTENTACV